MSLKNIGKNMVEMTATKPIAWRLYKLCGGVSDALGRIYGHARFAREISERDATLRRLTRELYPDLTVSSGPFRGLKYTRQSSGSTLLPKLLGSYESELHPIFEELLANDYSTIVDVGCAEGYYAVGLGIRFPRAEVYAFDTASSARQLCTELAELNGIAERVHVGAFCDAATLSEIPLGRKALIVSDCEGYEESLFTDQVISKLAQHDLIVETHDFISIDISTKLRDRFARTHRIRSIKSTDDIEKAHTYHYDPIQKYDAATRRMILAERRPAIMEWLVMTSKNANERNSHDR